jgi:hypothetical protein
VEAMKLSVSLVVVGVGLTFICGMSGWTWLGIANAAVAGFNLAILLAEIQEAEKAF